MVHNISSPHTNFSFPVTSFTRRKSTKGHQPDHLLIFTTSARTFQIRMLFDSQPDHLLIFTTSARTFQIRMLFDTSCVRYELQDTCNHSSLFCFSTHTHQSECYLMHTLHDVSIIRFTQPSLLIT